MVTGAIFGMALGANLATPVVGVSAGALAGIFIGWFIAAALQRSDSQEDKL